MLAHTLFLFALTFVSFAAVINTASAEEKSGPASPTIPLHLYVGTYCKPDEIGIHHLMFDPDQISLKEIGGVSGIENPSFVAISSSRKFLYSVVEVDTFNGHQGGGVVAFTIDATTGNLTKLNEQPTGGAAACHISLDTSGKTVMVANYMGGNLAAFMLNERGEVTPRTDFVQHVGSGPNKQRQEGPHAHSIIPSPDNRFAFAVDLGVDKIYVYKLDSTQGKLTPHNPAFAQVAAGAGPRHFTFHPNGRVAYVINELNGTITAFSYDDKLGKLQEIQTITTLPADYQGLNGCAEIIVHPNGKFLYGSNRGHDSLALYKIDELTGKLTPTGWQTAGIKEPRNFCLDPSGRFCLVGNQNGNNIAIFKVDQESGALQPTGKTFAISKPVCLRFLNSGKVEK